MLAAIETAAALQDKASGQALFALLGQKTLSPNVRRAALESLGTLADPKLPEAIQIAVADPDPSLRVAGGALLARLDPEAAATQLAAAFPSAAVREK